MAWPSHVSRRTAWIHHLPDLALQLLRARHCPAQKLVRGQSSEHGGGEAPAEARLDVPTHTSASTLLPSMDQLREYGVHGDWKYEDQEIMK